MLLLVDENIYTEGVYVLRSRGHDVVSIYERFKGMSDEHILDLAVLEGRVLVTRDRDFGELVYARRQQAPPAIIYIRLRNVTHEAYGVAAADFIDRGGERLPGHLVTLTPDGERWRPLPT